MIVVTGASGLLGSALLHVLSAKHDSPILALYHSHEPKDSFQNDWIQWRKCNLLSYDDIETVCEGATYIYHCAAVVSYDTDAEDKMLHDNELITENLVNFAIDTKVKKFLHVSSVATLGREQDSLLMNEQSFWIHSKENSAYSVSKYNAEMQVWRAAAEGLNVVIVNPAVILGEGNYTSGSGALFKHVYSEFPFYTKGKNGFVDVQDVAKAMHLLMLSDAVNQRYIISAGNFSYKYIFELMAKHLHRKPPRLEAGPFLSGISWRLMSVLKLFGKKSSITKQSARVANAVYEYDNTKLLKLIPEFAYNNIENSIARIAADFLAKHARSI